jgi:hypothetical protein
MDAWETGKEDGLIMKVDCKAVCCEQFIYILIAVGQSVNFCDFFCYIILI